MQFHHWQPSMSSGTTPLPEVDLDEAGQSHYLTRLLQEARQYFLKTEIIPQDLKDCDGEMAQAVKDCAKKTGEELQAEIYRLCVLLSVLPMFQERLAFAINYPPSKWLLEWEQPYLAVRRGIQKLSASDPTGTNPYEWAQQNTVRGICLSGGGIRSATFNLGVLQGLANLGLLKHFDYLSSVSGGGYIHQFLAAWIKREEERRKNDPARPYAVGDGFDEVVKKLDPIPNQHQAAFHPEPIKWLRRYSNYLTPSKGMFTADMWVTIAIWLRNTFLNQLVLLSGLLGLVFCARWIALALRYPIPTVKLAWIIALLFLVVSLYLGLALYREYLRTRYKDLEEAAAEKARLEAEARLKNPAKVDAPATDSPMVKGTLRRIIDAFSNLVLKWEWLSGEDAARGLGVLPLLLASCLSLGALAFGELSSASGVAWEVFLCLSVVALCTTFAGGAWREHSVLQDKSLSTLTWGGFWICVGSGVLAAGLTMLAFEGIWHLLIAYKSSWMALVVFGPPLLLFVPFLTLVLGAGLVGRDFQDWLREWLARIRAWSLMVGLFWMVAFALVLYSPVLVHWLHHTTSKLITTIKWSAVGAWLLTTAGSLLAGKSGKTPSGNDEEQKTSAMDVLAAVGPYVYLVGLLVLLSWAAWVLVTLGDIPECACSILICLAACTLVFLIFGWRVDINEFSLNSFYRNRLTRCYLAATNSRRSPSPLTGFDDRDTRGLQIARMLPKTPRSMMEGRPEKPDFVPYTGPFPIICTTLNLTFGEDLAWQERKAASFAFTPLYSGYTVGWTSGKRGDQLSFNGFVPTFNYAFPNGGINISTAVAISGAAANPNWGYHTSPATAFLMTMFDVRLGWWIRNPRRLTLAGQDPMVRGRKTDRASPRFAPIQLAKELLGMTDDTSEYVNLSDGGHFDNMGLYELVRRRCYNIVICDGEEDEKYVFEGLGMSIRKCRIDFGVEISLGDLRKIRFDDTEESSQAHFATGTIRYPEAGDAGWSTKEGKILYLKSSLTGHRPFTTDSGVEKKLRSEPADILNYKLQHEKFPHDPTANQWFTESQFESYRRLGNHVVEEMQACGAWEEFRTAAAKDPEK